MDDSSAVLYVLSTNSDDMVSIAIPHVTSIIISFSSCKFSIFSRNRQHLVCDKKTLSNCVLLSELLADTVCLAHV